MMPIAQQTCKRMRRSKETKKNTKIVAQLHRSNFLVRVILQGIQMKKRIPRRRVISILMPRFLTQFINSVNFIKDFMKTMIVPKIKPNSLYVLPPFRNKSSNPTTS
jgi:hypothetical protein